MPTLKMKKFFITSFYILILTSPTFSQNPDTIPTGLITIEEFPKFIDGNCTSFELWVYSNLRYPEKALSESISGDVIVRFYVDSLGFLNKASIVKGLFPDFNNEVLRVIESSPKWSPGKLLEKPHGVYLTFLIEFSIADKNFESKITQLSKQDKKAKKKHYR
jgi:TonB family protein